MKFLLAIFSALIIFIVGFQYDDIYAQIEPKTFFTDKEIYQVGELIKIQGHVASSDGKTPAIMRVFDKNGDMVHVDQATPDYKGDLIFSYHVGETSENAGMYTAIINYMGTKNEVTFSVTDSLTLPTPDDKDSVSIGEDTRNFAVKSNADGCGKGTILKDGKCEFLGTTVEVKTKLYYDDEYSFSIEYPEDWRVDDEGLTEDGVYFMDGYETGVIGTVGLWNTNISVILLEDMGEKLSDAEEKRWLIEAARDACDDPYILWYDCYDFQITDTYSGLTQDGYPIIILEYSYTKTYLDLHGEYEMRGIDSNIYVGTQIWSIVSESDMDVFDEHKEYIMNMIYSFKHPSSPPMSTQSDSEGGDDVEPVKEIPDNPPMSTQSDSEGGDDVEPVKEIPDNPPMSTQSDSEGGGCLIATATYGSELAIEVQKLREIRDAKLLQTEAGSNFMNSFNQFYYSFSPAIADLEREHQTFKEMVKITITPMLLTLSLIEHAETKSEIITMGMVLIVLNLGIYVGIPTLGAIVVNKQVFKKTKKIKAESN